MKKHRLSLVILSLLATGALAGAIKVWSSGETLTSAQLNANFAHLHSLMVGGHGARLVDADVSPSAAIATTKLAGGPLIPRSWVTMTYTNGACGTGAAACTVTTSDSMTITGSAVGVYNVALGYTAATATYPIIITPANAGSAKAFCLYYGQTINGFNILCADHTGAATDLGMSIVILAQ